MSSAIKWLLVLVILVGIGFLVWWSGILPMPNTHAPATSQNATTTAATTQQPDQNGMSAAGDTSDAALNQDSAAIDTQMQGLTTDSTNIDSSLNDQPVQQSY